jgi:hypothetical protein
MRTVIAYVTFDPETHLYAGIVPGVPGTHTQALHWTNSRRTLQKCRNYAWKSLAAHKEFTKTKLND